VAMAFWKSSFVTVFKLKAIVWGVPATAAADHSAKPSMEVKSRFIGASLEIAIAVLDIQERRVTVSFGSSSEADCSSLA
jgi:hypothetical protein